MAAITPVTLSGSDHIDEAINAGTFAGTAVAAGGDYVAFSDGYNVLLMVKNANAAARTITVHSQRNDDQGFENDDSQAIAQNDVFVMGPYSKGRWADANGRLQMTYTSEVDVTVLAYLVPVGGV